MRSFYLTSFFIKCTMTLLVMPFSIASAISQDESIELPNKSYILPDAIPMWPPVWWSWLILLAVFICIIGAVLTLLNRHRNNAYRREAIQLLQDTDKLADIELLTLCHQTVRRCLITKNRNDLASLPSHDLFPKLDQLTKGSLSFSQLGSRFINGAYQPSLQLSTTEKEAIIRTTIHWCRRHNA